MMNQQEAMTRLAARARQECPPQVDVAGRVMARIGADSSPTAPRLDALAWVAAGSFALAVPLAVYAFLGTNTWTDPLMDVLADLSGGLI